MMFWLQCSGMQMVRLNVKNAVTAGNLCSSPVKKHVFLATKMSGNV